MAPNHLRIDASVITSFTCGFDQEHIYQTATITIYNLLSLLEILKMLLKRISIPTKEKHQWTLQMHLMHKKHRYNETFSSAFIC